MGSWHRMQGNAACGTYSVRCCYSADELIWGRTRVTSRGSTVQDIRAARQLAPRASSPARAPWGAYAQAASHPRNTHTRATYTAYTSSLQTGPTASAQTPRLSSSRWMAGRASRRTAATSCLQRSGGRRGGKCVKQLADGRGRTLLDAL